VIAVLGLIRTALSCAFVADLRSRLVRAPQACNRRGDLGWDRGRGRL